MVQATLVTAQHGVARCDTEQHGVVQCGLLHRIPQRSDAPHHTSIHTFAQGLSHYLEHMLFMGSKKYPSENEYDDFISKHGGFSNAYTELVGCVRRVVWIRRAYRVQHGSLA